MEIKIFKPQSHKIKALIYGPSGSGKTTFGGTAKKAIFASSENGLLSIADKNVPYVEIKSLQDLKDLYTYLKKGEHEFETLVIDSITEISDIIKNQIEEKNKRKMTLQDWGVLSSEIEKIIKEIKNLDLNVIVIAQELNVDDEGKVHRIVPSLNGKSSTKICYYMDIVGYIYVDKNGTRKIITQNNDKLLTKDRTGKIGNRDDFDFEVWREIVNQMDVGDETLIYKDKTLEEKQQEEFNKMYEDLKTSKDLEDLKNKFLSITKNKKLIGEDKYKELASLKDDLKSNLENNS